MKKLLLAVQIIGTIIMMGCVTTILIAVFKGYSQEQILSKYLDVIIIEIVSALGVVYTLYIEEKIDKRGK